MLVKNLNSEPAENLNQNSVELGSATRGIRQTFFYFLFTFMLYYMLFCKPGHLEF